MRVVEAASLRIECRACGAWNEVVAEPAEADLRVAEFARQHAEHHRVAVDSIGVPIGQAYGVQRGNVKSPKKKED